MSGIRKVSIAMAVYNGEHFIGRQLDSFVRQTRLPDDLVVSDNASSDSTVRIVRDFAAYAPFPVRLFVNHRNLGVTKNFERAICKCEGEIIFLSDCDDVWYPSKIATMVSVLENNPTAGVVVCDADLVDERLRSLHKRAWKTYHSKPPKLLLGKVGRGKTFRRYLPAGGSCMAFRSKFKPLILPLPAEHSFELLGHDYFIAWCILCGGAAGIVFVPRALLAYRQHPRQTSRIENPSLPRFRARRQRPTKMLLPLIQRLESDIAVQYCANPELRAAALRHWRARIFAPKAKTGRIGIVVRELLAGRYHRFSGGLTTAVKDLLFVK